MKQTVQTKLKATIKLLNLIKLKFLHSRNGFVAILVLPSYIVLHLVDGVLCSALFAMNWCVCVGVYMWGCLLVFIPVCVIYYREQFVQLLPLLSFHAWIQCTMYMRFSKCGNFSLFKKKKITNTNENKIQQK